jgi:hypothetical protein
MKKAWQNRVKLLILIQYGCSLFMLYWSWVASLFSAILSSIGYIGSSWLEPRLIGIYCSLQLLQMLWVPYDFLTLSRHSVMCLQLQIQKDDGTKGWCNYMEFIWVINCTIAAVGVLAFVSSYRFWKLVKSLIESKQVERHSIGEVLVDFWRATRLAFGKSENSASTTEPNEAELSLAAVSGMGGMPRSDSLFKPDNVEIIEQKAVAIFDYQSEIDGELSFKEGDTIKVMSRDKESGWSYGLSIKTGREGMFPGNYVNFDDGGTSV